MNRRLLLSILFLITPIFFYAQQEIKWAQEIFELTQEGKGDSIYVRLNDEARKAVTPALLSQMFTQLEGAFGKYQRHDEWKTDRINGVKLYYTDIKFERSSLRFLLAFDTDGKMNTLRFIPVPASPVAKAQTPDTNVLEEKQIEVLSGKYKLPGILTIPKNQTSPPVVILVHGSGPQDRDETIGPNKPFRDIAWGLAKNGIASIRYDKRTLVYKQDFAPEGSQNYDTETVDDALAAVKLVQNNSAVDKNRIYIIGHSLGAILAPRIAERTSNELAGIIMIAGTTRSLGEILIEQMEYLSSLQDNPMYTAEQIDEMKKQIQNIKNIDTNLYDASIPSPLGAPREYWIFSNNYKPDEVAKSLKLPILILQGERDYHVTMYDYNLWKTALDQQPNVSFKSYPKLNHLLQEGSGKSVPSEYSEEKPVAIDIINDIADWIKQIR